MAKKKSTSTPVAAEPPRVIGADPTEPKLTAALLRRLLWVNENRRILESRARQLQTEENQLRDVAFAWMEDHEVTTVKKHGIRVTQSLGNAYPKWKEIFIAEVGAERATEIVDNTPKSVKLTIVKEG